MIYEFAKPQDLEQLGALLKKCKLPANDLSVHEFIIAKEHGHVVGSIGLESQGPLLRSLAVDPDYRNRGIAGELCSRLLNHAVTQGLSEIYLITDTADRYFQRIGFEQIHRSDAPESITTHVQFTTLCPSSAIVMRKDIKGSRR